jgi:hypothetical protein
VEGFEFGEGCGQEKGRKRGNVMVVEKKLAE